jgi:hypothetical protein
MRLMVEAAAAQPRVLAIPAPKVFLTLFADSSISLELGFWIADPEEGRAMSLPISISPSGGLSGARHRNSLPAARSAGRNFFALFLVFSMTFSLVNYRRFNFSDAGQARLFCFVIRL